MSEEKSKGAYVPIGEDGKVDTAVDIEDNQPPPAYDDMKVCFFIYFMSTIMLRNIVTKAELSLLVKGEFWELIEQLLWQRYARSWLKVKMPAYHLVAGPLGTTKVDIKHPYRAMVAN